MKKENITNQILVSILRALHTQNEILVDALDDKIEAKEEITRLMSADSKVEHLLMEILDNE
jgi:hypothetical protein